jgi:elongation factor 1 alpha-like protein
MKFSWIFSYPPPGEYESSMSDGAQTREHAVLLKALGVSQIVVVVNKMDAFNPAWDQGRFLLIETQMRALLEELQFPPKAIRFVPLSGLSGVNLITPPGTDCALSSWYTGPTLLQAMDTFKPPVRRMDAPLRAVITSVLAEGPKGCDVSVSVLQGRIRVGRGVGLASAAGAATVKKVSDANGTQLNVLVAGEKGTVQLIDR